MTVSRVVTIADAEFAVADNAYYGPFWDRVAQGRWEPRTFAVLDRFLDPHAAYLDLGAWIGPTVLYAASRAAITYAIEPDPFARRELELNLALNPGLRSRVEVSGFCVATETGPVELHAGGMYATANSRFGDSMTSLLGCADTADAAVLAADGITLEDFTERYGVGDCGAIKMDVEGGEFAILASHRRYWNRTRPTLFVSFHAPPAAIREAMYREAFDTLRSTYPYIYDCKGQPLDLAQLADAVGDWSDDTASSPWSKLDQTTGTGIVASNAPW